MTALLRRLEFDNESAGNQRPEPAELVRSANSLLPEAERTGIAAVSQTAPVRVCRRPRRPRSRNRRVVPHGKLVLPLQAPPHNRRHPRRFSRSAAPDPRRPHWIAQEFPSQPVSAKPIADRLPNVRVDVKTSRWTLSNPATGRTQYFGLRCATRR